MAELLFVLPARTTEAFILIAIGENKEGSR